MLLVCDKVIPRINHAVSLPVATHRVCVFWSILASEAEEGQNEIVQPFSHLDLLQLIVSRCSDKAPT